MNAPHKWAKEIHAWADGADVEFRANGAGWRLVQCGSWVDWGNTSVEFRVAPKRKVLRGRVAVYCKYLGAEPGLCVLGPELYIGMEDDPCFVKWFGGPLEVEV